MEHSPLEQFRITTLFPLAVEGYDISITNSSMAMFIVLAMVFLFLGLSVRNLSPVPSRLQAAGEMVFGMVDGMITSTAGVAGRQFMPFIFTLFLFIITCNLLGMIPYSFTATSHIAVTFAMAIFIFVSVTIIGFIRHGTHFLSLFMPQGIHWSIAPLMILIELFAYMVRPVSLSCRLAANMTAGHIVLKVIAGFVLMFPVISIMPFLLLIILTGFEIFVAVLQAYIFTILTCVYLNDAINLH